MWDGLRMNLPMSVFLTILAFMRRAAWTTNGTEQAHVLSSGMLRIHKRMQMLMLQVRSVISGMQRLLSTTKEERQLKRARAKLNLLDKKKPQHCTGRQLYVRELNATAEQFREQGRDVGPDIAAKILMQHGKGWKNMSQANRDDYDARALDEHPQMRQDIFEDKCATVEDIERLKSLIKENRSVDAPILLSQCKFSESDRLDLQAEFESKLYTGGVVDEALRKAQIVVGPPHEEVRTLLGSVELETQPMVRPRPPWTSLLRITAIFFKIAQYE
jgi:hypothetical protein